MELTEKRTGDKVTANSWLHLKIPLINSMELNPCRIATSCAAIQELPSAL
jgi:hypothetical protein